MDMRKNVNFGLVACYEQNNAMWWWVVLNMSVFPMSVLRFQFWMHWLWRVCMCLFDYVILIVGQYAIIKFKSARQMETKNDRWQRMW